MFQLGKKNNNYRYPPYNNSKVSQMLFLQRHSINFKKLISFLLIILIPILLKKYKNFDIFAWFFGLFYKK
jgi:hypothetical protein